MIKRDRDMKAKGIFIGAALAALVTTSACTTDPETGQRTISKTALGGIGGALGGYLLGDIVGGRNDRTEKLLGAGIGGLAGAGVGAYMDKQERDLRARTAGTDVQVIRQGDDLVLNIPSGITFAYDSATVQPQFQRTLDQVASTLGQYNQTYIDVYGHTDSTGSDSYNEPRRPVRPHRHPRLWRKPADRLERHRRRPRRQPPRRGQDRPHHPERPPLTPPLRPPPPSSRRKPGPRVRADGQQKKGVRAEARRRGERRIAFARRRKGARHRFGPLGRQTQFDFADAIEISRLHARNIFAPSRLRVNPLFRRPANKLPTAP
jgi:hypothetical protein